jgi:hypothetical protein
MDITELHQFMSDKYKQHRRSRMLWFLAFCGLMLLAFLCWYALR